MTKSRTLLVFCNLNINKLNAINRVSAVVEFLCLLTVNNQLFTVIKIFLISCSQIALSIKKASEDYAPMAEGMEAHWEVVERILFLYAKLNPGQGYVQGMNEIIGPIYYSFACNPDSEWRGECNCSSLFIFLK